MKSIATTNEKRLIIRMGRKMVDATSPIREFDDDAERELLAIARESNPCADAHCGHVCCRLAVAVLRCFA